MLPRTAVDSEKATRLGCCKRLQDGCVRVGEDRGPHAGRARTPVVNCGYRLSFDT